MILMFAVDKNYSIGYKGDMLFHISEDLKRFKKLTVGNIVIMGRKTLESLPKAKALKNRDNIVLTNNLSYEKENAYVVHSIGEMDEKIKELNPDGKKDVFLIGGGNLVKQLYDRCTYAYITEIDKEFKKFDTQIPNIKEDPNWEKIKESNIRKSDELTYKYVEYKRK